MSKAKTDLCGKWRLAGTDLLHGAPTAFLDQDISGTPWIDASVPGDVHLDLIANGDLGDYDFGLEARKAQWVDHSFWIYRKDFDFSGSTGGSRYFLVFEAVDCVAIYFLNGKEIGRSENAFLTNRFEVTSDLQAGVNAIAVIVESGQYSAMDRPAKPYHWDNMQPTSKRAWLRKPQYVFGWDWNPKLVSVGLTGRVFLEEAAPVSVRDFGLSTSVFDDNSASVCLRLSFADKASSDLVFRLQASCPELGFSGTLDVVIKRGSSISESTFLLPKVERWWPIHFGKQTRYEFTFELSVNSSPVWQSNLKVGFRAVALIRSPHSEGGESFVVHVNGTPIFCRGANWVPGDALYAAQTPESIETLVDRALEANFNCLRIWGGAVYAPASLLELCDRHGLLVWHDFVFACSQYPINDPAFLQSVRREVTEVVRHRAHHPSLIVWCGNNEIDWVAWEGNFSGEHAWPDYALYHGEMPRIIHQESPSQAYWPSSPYSEYGYDMQDKLQGDQHPWDVSLGSDSVNFHAYRKDPSRFANEGGYLGAGLPATLEKYLGKGMQLQSPEWIFHDNSENCRPDRQTTYRAIQHWLGIPVTALSTTDYLYFSALIQAEAIQEFINNFRRRMFDSSAALFWMFNDSWPTTHSWTIVDCDLRRRLPFHPVRRAFRPVSIICVIDGDDVLVIGVNDTSESWCGTVRQGSFSTDRTDRDESISPAVLAPNSRTVLNTQKLGGLLRDTPGLGHFAVLCGPDCEPVAQHRIFASTFGEIPWVIPSISVEQKEDALVFLSAYFVWGVCLDSRGDLSLADDVFDLLPGVPVRIPWSPLLPRPTQARVGNLTEARWVDLQYGEEENVRLSNGKIRPPLSLASI